MATHHITADDKLMTFSYFSKKIGYDDLHEKLKPLFGIGKKNITKYCVLNFLPSMKETHWSIDIIGFVIA